MKKNELTVTERLNIYNFFSITKFEWEINDFNILTGEMAAGKSLCVKLVYFLEHILHRNIFLSDISHDTLKKEVFYAKISEQFHSIFHSVNPEKDFLNTKIIYTFKVQNHEFDLKAEWKNNTKKLEWTSKYIDTHIGEWRSFISGQNADDNAAGNIKAKIKESIAGDFFDFFPITTRFIPATRAIASVIEKEKEDNKNKKNTENEKNTLGIKIKDIFLSDFMHYAKHPVTDFHEINNKLLDVNKLLHINRLSIHQYFGTDEEEISLITTGERKITPLELSSGQQELLYLLLLVNDISPMTYLYDSEKNKRNLDFTKNLSVFIEEPSAHLFPQEQKDTIEFIAQTFRKLKDDNKINVRFFITTHSPYVLNVINNMLKKGAIIKNNKKQQKYINGKIKFPHLYKDELSAIFIKRGKRRNMLDRKEGVMFADEIADISFSINKDTNDLDTLNNELIAKEKK